MPEKNSELRKLIEEVRLLRLAIEARSLGAGPTARELRPVYTAEQFAAEALGANRTAAWVRKQCRIGKIKHVARRPFLIPRSEAERFESRLKTA